MQLEHDVEKAPLLDGAQVVAPIGIDVTVLKLLSSHRQCGGPLGVGEHLHQPDLIRGGTAARAAASCCSYVARSAAGSTYVTPGWSTPSSSSLKM